MKKLSILLFTLFATFSVAYTLSTEKQDDNDDQLKSLMDALMKATVVKVQEDENQKSSEELQSALNELLSQVQGEEDEDGEGGARKQDGDDLLALLQEDEEDGEGARKQEGEDEEEGVARKQDSDDDDDVLAFLQEGEEKDEGGTEQDDEGGDAVEQRWFGRIFSRVRRFGRRVRKACSRVSRYSRALNCLPRMQAEMQKADEGDEELVRDMLKRIAKVQQQGGDDAEAQFFKKLFRGVRKVFRRGKRIFRGVRKRFGGLIRGYRRIRRCIRRYRG